MVIVMKKLLMLLLLIPFNIFAYSPYIYASGENIGIELKSKGITVMGLYKVDDVYPASIAGLEVGDIIFSIDDDEVFNVNDLVNKINDVTNDTIKIGYIRNNIKNYANLKLVKENNLYKTGMYVKDSITGVGTLTYIDPSSKIFGALGHEISENSNVFEANKGSIYKSKVIGFDKSDVNEPGSVKSKYDKNNILGSVYENTVHGVFGKYDLNIEEDNLYKVADVNEIKKGDAYILTTLDGNTVGKYKINVLKLNKSVDTKNILFEIKDDELLNKTGGIVQGMSGSPIIQDDKIIGAVTHVITSSPNKGYGIFITNMLEEGEN